MKSQRSSAWYSAEWPGRFLLILLAIPTIKESLLNERLAQITTAVSQRGFQHLFFFFFREERHTRSPDSFHQLSLKLNYKVLNGKRLGELTAAHDKLQNAIRRSSHLRTNKCGWCLDNSSVFQLTSQATLYLFLFLASYEILMSNVWWSESTQTLLLCNGPPLCLVLHLCHPNFTPSHSVQ